MASIDLAFEHEGRWWLLDWKSNQLGASDADYSPAALDVAMHEAHYTLQYHLYLLALHRHLRARQPGYDPAAHWGGVAYVFLRGVAGVGEQGWFRDTPTPALLDALDAAWGTAHERERRGARERGRAGDRGPAVVPSVETLREMLHALHRARLLEPVDVQLAEMLVRRGDEAGERGLVLALATACASRARREGHSAVTLEQLVLFARQVESQRDTLGAAAASAHAGGEAVARAAARDAVGRGGCRQAPMHRSRRPVDLLAGVTFGDASWWRAHLQASPHVGDGSANTPLVLQGDLLQFKRYHEAEQRIATFVQRRVAESYEGTVKPFSIVTGGPGTGKTTLRGAHARRCGAARPGLSHRARRADGKGGSAAHRVDPPADGRSGARVGRARGDARRGAHAASPPRLQPADPTPSAATPAIRSTTTW